MTHPMLYFVGAGPGDPELLTVRALRLLQSADIVLYDALVSDDILKCIRHGALRLNVGKRAHGASMPQTEINRLLISLCKPDRCVVRLKGGDPAIFGRLGEEIEAVRDAGIAHEIVPGITTASAAAARAGLSLTHRGISRRVQFVAAHARHGDALQLDWQSLADPLTTLVFYMARDAAVRIATGLTGAGLSADTPALVMMDVSRPSEVQNLTTVGALSACVDSLPRHAPLIVLVGEALRAAATECLAQGRRHWA